MFVYFVIVLFLCLFVGVLVVCLVFVVLVLSCVLCLVIGSLGLFAVFVVFDVVSDLFVLFVMGCNLWFVDFWWLLVACGFWDALVCVLLIDVLCLVLDLVCLVTADLGFEAGWLCCYFYCV